MPPKKLLQLARPHRPRYYKMMCRERKRARRCVDLLARSVPDSAAGPEELHDSLVPV